MDDGPLVELAAASGARRAENWKMKTLRDPAGPPRMRKFLREGDFDVVQCYGLRAEALTRWIARGLGIKVVSSVCSIDPWRRWYHLWLDRLTMDGVSLWISTSDAARNVRIEREGVPERRIVVIPTGIPDRPVADAAARARAHGKFQIAPNSGPVLAVIANIRTAKGHCDLIQALAILKKKYPALICLCAGRDDSGGAIARQAGELGLGDSVRWLGFSDDAPEVYDAADLAVLPSHWEGMPLSGIEALRAGLPTVATDVGGIGEVIRDEKDGLLCPARDPERLAARIDEALSRESDRRAWGENARKRFDENFRVELMVERTTEVIEALSNGRA
jgi:glycosyltransferase involved in cell wall biosynthesis